VSEIESEVGQPRGILNRRVGEHVVGHSRIAPSRDIADFVEHFWVVRWDLRGQEPQVAETLPHPSAHVVIENRGAKIYGVMTGKFSRRLRGRGRVFGIKFRPGAFQPFLNQPMSAITDRTLALRQVFGPEGVAFQKAIQNEADEQCCATIAERFVRARSPDLDPSLVLVRNVVERILQDTTLTQVEQVAEATVLSIRELQRLFQKYIGVSPKWVIQRYRLHEAVEQLSNGSPVSLSELALRLGYFDQAHFIRDFKAVVGKAPGKYMKSLGDGPPSAGLTHSAAKSGQ
jgi:AraC-like DNA-binding protein